MSRSGRTARRLAIGGCALALTAIALPASAQTFKVNLRPLNQSGVTGTGSLTLSADKTQLTVKIDAKGLEPNQVHVGHIHGLVSGGKQPADSSIPSPKQDSDRDKFVELKEGEVTYGPILITLGTDNGGNLDPDGDGIVRYEQTFNLDDATIYDAGFNKMSVIGSGNSLQLREIILHGLTVPAVGVAPGEVDGTAGFKTVLPVAGGEIGTAGDALKFRSVPGQ
ncbi:MAG: CHRD domain-containing protein [Sphingomicrobium sp.]